MSGHDDRTPQNGGRRSFDTQSWVEEVRQHGGNLINESEGDMRDDYGYLKPPTAGPSRLDRKSSCTFALTTLSSQGIKSG